ncbi:(Fe-S)-binding protein [Desulfonema magnum]|uniref:Lactate utilization protein A, LutA n=1 Tax=Desulfonema magnum TaxID=45655 RepID=A0A975BTU4_9BACT|nr:(Fe-S)-binding protein [Desulfonema magnum]QTA91606.1 Putative lactate utilization protein A, LutA [Desulfonema magnum]
MMINKNITLFIQCIIDGMYPEVGEAMVQIFQKLGVSMTCPTDQTCCGQPAFNSGYRKEAREAAKRFIRIFENAELIVCPSGSCVNMVRHHYPELFHDDPKWLRRSEQISSTTYEFTEYLVDVLGVEDVGASYRGKITYHDSCHLLRGIGVREQPRKLIRNVRGTEFTEMKDSDRCCGFGGAFSVKYPEISTAMAEDKVKNITDSGADVVVGCDMGCLMNIQGMLSRKESSVRVMHIAQLLALRA